MILKTLKELKIITILNGKEHKTNMIAETPMREEAIKWVKYYKRCMTSTGQKVDISEETWIKFFNITEKELK